MARGDTHIDEYIDVTGRTVISEDFDGCVVRFDTDPSRFTVVEGCRFINCQQIGDGWPKPFLIVKIPKSPAS